MIDRPAGAYVETESGLLPDMSDKAMAEKKAGKELRAESEEEKTIAGWIEEKGSTKREAPRKKT